MAGIGIAVFVGWLIYLAAGSVVSVFAYCALIISIINGWAEPTEWFLQAFLGVTVPWFLIFVSYPLWPAEIRNET